MSTLSVNGTTALPAPAINYTAVALEALCKIINDPRSSREDVLDAAKALLDYLKL